MECDYRNKKSKTVVLDFWFLFCRNDLDPVVVGVIDEIDAEIGIFETDAAHFFMFCICCVIIFCYECQMEFVFTQIVGIFSVSQPCQFQCEIGFAVTQINQFPAAVFCFFAANFFQAQRIFVEFHAFFQIQDVVVEMIEFEHTVFLLISGDGGGHGRDDRGRSRSHGHGGDDVRDGGDRDSRSHSRRRGGDGRDHL